MLLALPAAALPALRVQGTRLVDERGRAVRLRGVNCASLEWSADGDGRIQKTVEVAVVGWRANLIRLPLSQDRWFGKGPEQSDGGVSYRRLVRQIVDYCAERNAYVMLDLQWSDAGEWGRRIGQHRMPDRNSVAFWTNAATAFKNHPAVLFDLYNEPHDVTWDEWSKGGQLTETDEKTKEVYQYQAVGMPALFNAVRATGARNVVVVAGINWAFELGGILDGRKIVDSKGRGVVYAVHPYPHKYDGLGLEKIDQWVARFEAFSKKLPLMVTEFGSIEEWWPFPKEWNYSDEKWNRETLRQLEAHGWSWAAWDFHPTAKPSLISGWDYEPTPSFGVWVKKALTANPPVPARLATPLRAETKEDKRPKPAEGVKPVGLDHVGLWTSNIESSVAFYRDFLGLVEMQRGNEVPNAPNVYYWRDGSPENLAKEKMGRLFMVKFWVGNNQALELFPARTPILEGKSLYHFAVGFEDQEAVRRALRAVNAEAPAQAGTGNFFTYDKNITGAEILESKPRTSAPAMEKTDPRAIAISSHLLSVEISGENLADLQRFYTETLNFRENAREKVRLDIGASGEQLLLNPDKSQCPGIGFEVKSLEAARSFLESSPWRSNYKKTIQIETVAGRRCILLEDPEGVRIALWEGASPQK